MFPHTTHRPKPKRAGNPSDGSRVPARGSGARGSAARAGSTASVAVEAPEEGASSGPSSLQQSAVQPSPFKQSIEKVRAVVEPILVAHHVDFVEISWVTERTGRSLRVTIERSGVGPSLEEQLLVGFGVSLEDCVDVSRDISAALDLADIIPHAYSLEVSSPGLDRPLRHVADFTRFKGQLAKLKLREPASDGQRVLRGRIESVQDDSTEALRARISMEVDGKRIEVLYGNVEAANLVYELPAQPKSSPSRATFDAPRSKPQTKPHAVPGKPSRFSRDGLKTPKKGPTVPKAPSKGTGPKRGKPKGER